MTTPVTSSATLASADVYTDFAGLAALKKSARSNDPEALRAVAKQYESLFARMMIKSMRDAVGKDPIFGSDEEQTYQGMYDDQLSIEMTKGHGLGLADMLVRQMQRLTGGSRTDAADKTDSSRASTAGHTISSGSQSMSHAALRRYQEQNGGSPGRSPSANVSPQAQSDFISELWPTAQEAGRQLGVDPRNLIAQAALETNWGTHVPRDAGGRSSNNLFGMKTGGQWTGAAVSAETQEYDNGTPVTTTSEFRSYDSRAHSFQDYVALLRNSPRYAAALNTGSNTHAFATALQRGGYATDPQYASKITAIANGIGQRPATIENPFKSASALPITPTTGVL
ncbi:MAG TPA: flagellar assembly peptidoglycan hydrolase FlgJ [Steroidobacteraceae bacterium]|nr:flagellar assembly peptidoglycan hydrolase FlgJ [Steroidobacteraceae bacterium]